MVFAEYVEEVVDIKEKFKEFITLYKRGHYRNELKNVVLSKKKSIVIDMTDILDFDMELVKKIINQPNDVIPKLEEVVTEIARTIDPEYVEEVRVIHVRFRNLPEKIKLRELRDEHIGKLIMVEGILTRMSQVKQKVKKLWFRCEACGMEFPVPQPTEFITVPTACPNPDCPKKTGPFTPLMNHPKNEYTNWQDLLLQERPEEVPSGQLPRSIEVVVDDDLVDSARPGDRVTIVGILEPMLNKPVRKSSTAVFPMRIKANYIEVSKKVLEEIELTPEDLQKIKELAKDPNIHRKIVASIAPAIYGHWDIKEAIALLLFGGVPKRLEDGTRIRGDIHVLIIGDPGTAKSQLLQYAARIAPRSVYTTGKGSTAAGLTAAVIRDKSTGEFYLEAGALVLADGGVAVIDEIDKMREEDRVAIHEAMEQQTVSIAKAGIIAQLNARTSVLAAGNPRYGKYLPNRTVSENINLPPSILSRFDLIFVLRDIPNPEADRKMVKHILRVHRDYEHIKPEIPIDLLKKYIVYARKYIKPKLSDEAEKLIEEFFVDLRRKAAESGDLAVPITARQLEALIRLAEAHAKMALRDVVTKADAEAAIRLMLAFLQTVGLDVETGKIDVTVIMAGSTTSQAEKMALVSSIIKELSSEKGCAEIREIIKAAKEKGIDKETLEKIIMRLRRTGEIYEKSTGCFAPVP